MATVDVTRELNDAAGVLDRLAILFDLIAEVAGRTVGCQQIEALAIAGEALARTTGDTTFVTARTALRAAGGSHV